MKTKRRTPKKYNTPMIRRIIKSSRLCLACLSLVAVIPNVGVASLEVYESFNYVDDTFLDGTTPSTGIGWASDWQDSAGNGLKIDEYRIANSSSGTSSYRDLQNSFSLNGSDRYLSFLVRQIVTETLNSD